jgi:transposase-like protein
MVAAARRGTPMREVARRFGVALSTVQFWVARAGRRRLDRVDWADRPDGPRRPANRTPSELEDLVLSLRRELKEASDLGEFGARAIHAALEARGVTPLPAVRTIGRILERRGALDGRRRVRRPPPPPGWYLPELAAGRAELDSFDIVEGLVIKGGPAVEVLNVTSLHGGLVNSWATAGITAKAAVEALVEHWRAVGLPDYAQFDNDTIFQGAHQHPDVVGRVTRTCLGLGVVPVFAPPRETGFQAAIESYNGRWQAKVWARFVHESLSDLRGRSDRYVAAARARSAARIEAAPARRPFPAEWAPDLQARPHGRIIYLRRAGATGGVELLGRHFEVDATWPHRLVRAEVDLDAGRIRFYALRRRDPTRQPLLRELPYSLPRRRFRE